MTAVKSILAHGGFLELKQGAFASLGGKPCKIRRILSMDSVVIEYVDTGETERTHPTELRPVEQAREPGNPEQATTSQGDSDRKERGGQGDIQDISDADWAEATRILAVIKPLFEKPNRTRADVEVVASAQGVRVGTVYEWMSNYRDSGHLSGLIKSRRGRKRG